MRMNSEIIGTNMQVILDVLSRAKEPVTREQLARETGVEDRTVRKCIQKLRIMGVPICSNSHRKGYTLATGDELNHMVADYRARGLACLEVARKIQLNRQLEGQEVWHDL